MLEYHRLLNKVLTDGKFRGDRTGTGTYSVFGEQARYDLSKGFPLLTTKKMFMKGITHELLWFIAGDTNNKTLKDKGVNIWNEWATAEQCAKFGRVEDDLGPIYGHLWRNFGGSYNNDEVAGVDQLKWVINEIRTNPNSRRLIVSGWDPKEQNNVALPPCHTLFQFYVEDMTREQRLALFGEGWDVPKALEEWSTIALDVDVGLDMHYIPRRRLNCQLYQRSADLFLGVPFNIASYALLTHMIAQICGLAVGDFVHSFGDLHLYSNHLDQAKEQLARTPTKLPNIELNWKIKEIEDFKFEDIKLVGYESAAPIKAPIAI